MITGEILIYPPWGISLVGVTLMVPAKGYHLFRETVQEEGLIVFPLGYRSHIDMLTIINKTAHANAISHFVKDLRLAAFHRQEEIAIISVDAMMHLRPLEDLDGFIVYINGFTIFKQ